MVYDGEVLHLSKLSRNEVRSEDVRALSARFRRISITLSCLAKSSKA
jgi:hypothetical protein